MRIYVAIRYSYCNKNFPLKFLIFICFVSSLRRYPMPSVKNSEVHYCAGLESEPGG
jgi:hypothetical protein